MNIRLAGVVAAILAAGCARVKGTYVGARAGPPRAVHEVRVLYGDQSPPAGYVEVGRVFTRFRAAGARDPGAQVEVILEQAAKHGADAVIVYEARSEKTTVEGGTVAFAAAGSAGTSGVEVRYYGIALAREKTAAPAR